MVSFKEEILGGKLGGNRKDFWDLLKLEKVGLISFSESEVDQIEGIGDDEVKEVRPSLYSTNNSSSKVDA